ncbi:MAG: hypothetical protein EBU03_00960 [Methylophilaceae bacterium]|nr:hypothetical protein [Methylophilaceae bacterium]
MSAKKDDIPTLTEIYGEAPARPVLSPAFFEYVLDALKPDLDKALMEAQARLIPQLENDLFDKVSARLQSSVATLSHEDVLLKRKIHQAFADELPAIRQDISDRVNAEIEALIQSVRLVTNKPDKLSD